MDKTELRQFSNAKKITLKEYSEKLGYIIQDGPGETKPYTPSPLALCGQLEDAILLLENRISNAIAKINSLM